MSDQSYRLRKFTAAGLALAATAAVIVLLANRDDDRSAAVPAPSAPPPVRVVVPGRPGESATVSDSDRVRAPDGSTYNGIDVAFAQMMIVHHGQAIEMAGLAPGRAADARVQALAGRVAAAQRPEVNRLRSWLRARQQPVDEAGHDHATMPGMQPADAMAALRSATGAGFDRRFVTMLTAHHRGALTMAADVLRGGTDQTLAELANEMSVEQGSEIRRMAELRLG